MGKEVLVWNKIFPILPGDLVEFTLHTDPPIVKRGRVRHFTSYQSSGPRWVLIYTGDGVYQMPVNLLKKIDGGKKDEY